MLKLQSDYYILGVVLFLNKIITIWSIPNPYECIFIWRQTKFLYVYWYKTIIINGNLLNPWCIDCELTQMPFLKDLLISSWLSLLLFYESKCLCRLYVDDANGLLLYLNTWVYYSSQNHSKDKLSFWFVYDNWINESLNWVCQ